MGTTELYKYRRTIEEAREATSDQLKTLAKGFDEEHDPPGSKDNVNHYADALSSLVFEAIDNAIFWTDKVNDLEAFRDHVQGAIDSLETAIAVLKRSEEKQTRLSAKHKEHH
ncbi:MAG: hypothetical protein U9Q75_09815 [Pseudomonadota bacterium]|nr:hypothetical protein [Pseudomonadota bacterium]